MSNNRWWCVLLLGVPAAVVAQSSSTIVTEMQRRATVIRSGLPQIVEAAEYAASLMARDTSYRFQIPALTNPGLSLEFSVRAGGLVEVGDALTSRVPGIALMPIRAWGNSTFAVDATIADLQANGKVVLLFGSKSGSPVLPAGRRLIDNGAPDGSRALASVNDVVNMITMWTFTAEFVAAATRKGWAPGVYLSVMMPRAEAHNDAIRFRIPASAGPVAPIAAGQLGSAYLDGIDSVLRHATTLSHQRVVQQAADSLRAVRAAGKRIYVSSCGHYLLAELQGDSLTSPFRPVDWRWDSQSRLTAAGARPGDAMLWFGYGGFDCPNVVVSGSLTAMGMKAVVVTDSNTRTPEATSALRGALAVVPLSWRLPDAVVPLPFAPGSVGPVSSVEMAFHYLWLRELVSRP